MPYINEIAIRLNDPSKYERFRRKEVPPNHHWSEKFGQGNVDYIYGYDKDTKQLEIQAVRIKVKSPKEYSLAEIEAYVKEQQLKPIQIEMPKDYNKKSLFDQHPFEVSKEPIHLPGFEYYHGFESSIIKSFEFDYKNNVLRVEFNNGQQYLYASLPQHVADGFHVSISKGQFFSQKIKNCYPCKKIHVDETVE